MRYSRQLFQASLRQVKNFNDLPARIFAENGNFVVFKDPGLPFFMPLGKRIMERLTGLFHDMARQLGLDVIEVPLLMRNDLLRMGQHVGNIFARKILNLSEPLDKYHLLTTPEMLLINLASDLQISYRQLPIRFLYQTEFFRGIPHCAGLQKSRQFKCVVGTSFDADSSSLAESLKIYERLMDMLCAAIDLPIFKRHGHSGLAFQHFYLGGVGDNLELPEVNSNQRVRALELAMAYHYKPTNLPPRFRTNRNTNSRVLVGTFGLGLSRLLLAIFDHHRDSLGFKFPVTLRPVTLTVIPSTNSDMENSLRIYTRLVEQRLSVAIDDRINIGAGSRAALSDQIGAPIKLIIKKGALLLCPRGILDMKPIAEAQCTADFFETQVNSNSQQRV